ncbi:MAG: hypothetical protein RLZZ383_146 [Pseudomonadota bacterium]|jgi:hypothetical protein
MHGSKRLGLLVGFSLIGAAWAYGDAAPSGTQPADEVCQVFAVGLDPLPLVDTRDATSPAGAFVAAQRAAGGGAARVSVQTATKPTGYPTAYAVVCVTHG